MGTPSPLAIYAVDTSSLITLQPMPRRTFGLLWSRIDALAEARRFLVPEEVQRELGDDAAEEPVAWLRTHNDIVISTINLWDRAREVANQYRNRGLVDLAKPNGSADPYVIALALHERDRQRATLWECPVIIVTQERRKRPGKVAIPDACDDYGLTATNLQGLFDSEGWSDL
jgi:hypothetical protein